MIYTPIEKQLIRHEGLRLKPYKCTANKLTIGIGRNLDDNGISEEEAVMMLRNDITTVYEELKEHKWFNEIMDMVREEVLINMAFNIGIPRLLGFKRMIEAIKVRNWKVAAVEMLDSKWADQVGRRAKELAEQMVTGRRV